jgi:hypothetical protein
VKMTLSVEKPCAWRPTPARRTFSDYENSNATSFTRSSRSSRDRTRYPRHQQNHVHVQTSSPLELHIILLMPVKREGTGSSGAFSPQQILQQATVDRALRSEAARTHPGS